MSWRLSNTVLLAWVAALATGASLLAGCGSEDGVLIRLRPDLARNTEAEVIAELVELELWLDAAEGFDNLGEAAGFEVTDADGDGLAELRLALDVWEQTELPVIRLDPGSNGDRTIAVTLRGLDASGRPAAWGGLSARALFVGEGLATLDVPFNLGRSRLPPRVVALAPFDPPAGAVEGLAWTVSAPLDPSTLPGRVHVHLLAGAPPAPAGAELAGSLSGPAACPEESETWTFTPEGCHDLAAEGGAGLRLILDPGIADTRGRVLLGADGNPGAALDLLWNNRPALGTCAAVIPCTGQGTFAYRPDLLCDRGSGRWRPADCSHAPTACLPAGDVAGFLLPAPEGGCGAWRADALASADGLCLVEDPWSCDAHGDCADFGSSRCEMGRGQCQPAACSGGCPAGLACDSGGRCLPVIPLCQESCEIFGACPEIGRICGPVEGGAACR